MILKFFSFNVEFDYQVLFLLINATKFFNEINVIDRFLIKRYWFIDIDNYKNKNENIANVIDKINQFESSFDEQFKNFQKRIDFAHENLIKTFNTFVHLKIVNNKKFDLNVAFLSINRKNIFKKFIVVVNS